MLDIQSITALFWSKVKVGKPDECWEWQAYRTPFGYGMMTARKVSRMPMTSHTIAWRLACGPIPDGGHVLHKCDNPPCCNPAHLFIGDQQSNTEDRVRKGRTASGDKNGARTMRGRNPFVQSGGSGLCKESHPMAKLTEEQVSAIRAGFTGKRGERSRLAETYGVSLTHIGRILSGRSWRDQ